MNGVMQNDIFNVRVDIKDVSGNATPLQYSYDKEQLKEFRKLILENKLFSRTDDIFLLSFLRVSKFDQQRALQLLKNYYDARKRYPEIYSNLNPTELRNCVDLNLGGYLSTTDQNGSVIAIARCKYWDTEIVAPKDVLRNVLLHADLLLNDHLIQINGMTVIFDAEGFSWRHLLQLTPRLLYVALSSLYIHLHTSGIESLHQFIPSEYLSSDYGGTLPLFDPSECNELLKKHEDFFIQSEKYWTTKRV